MRLTQIIEALLFASDAPLSAEDLSRVDERLDEDTVEAVIRELRAEYELSERSFQIYEVAGGFQLLTRPEFVTVLERYDSVPQPSRLSVPALEVLSIVAYRQPLGRAEIEDIRGVGSSGVLRTLVERDLVAPVGRAEGLGRPLLYGTTKKFLEHFGFRSLEDLPRPEELPVVLRERPAQPDPDATEDADSEPAQSGEAAHAPSAGDAARSEDSAAAGAVATEPGSNDAASAAVGADDATEDGAAAEAAATEEAAAEEAAAEEAAAEEAAAEEAAADAGVVRTAAAGDAADASGTAPADGVMPAESVSAEHAGADAADAQDDSAREADGGVRSG